MTGSKKLGFSVEVENELARRRTASQRIKNEHERILEKEHPDLFRMKKEIGLIALEYSDKIVNSPSDAPALSELARGVIAEKKAQLKRAFIENGLPEDYLEAKPVCPVCRDRGVVDGELCSCMRKFLIDRRFPGSGLIPGQTFENFRHDLIEDKREARALDRIYSYCLSYAEAFPSNELPDLLICGEPGVGKTFLLNSIGERVLKKGWSVLRITANRLISDVLEAIKTRGSMPDLILPELLILDDLGTEPMINNVTAETLLSVIAERQDGDRPTLIATNKSLDGLAEDYGSRICSRLITPHRVKVIKMTTPSIRLTNIRALPKA